MTKEPFLRMESIVKASPGVAANDRIDLAVERGKTHGLLGENGAGKSMLTKILYGLYSQDDSEISLSGTWLRLDSPQDAIDAGTGMVHQHSMLIPRLTTTENVVLDERKPATPFRPDADAGEWLPDTVRSNSLVQSSAGRFSLGLDVPERRIQELANRYGFNIDVSAKVWEPGVGQQQHVKILKALYRDVDLLILDEPTAVLTPTEADPLFDSLERLTDEGVSIIFITHKLEEIEAVIDRVTVLRDGESVGTISTSDISRADPAGMMAGCEVLFTIDRERVAPGEPVLRARNVSATGDRGVEALSNVDLTVRHGEVVGIAGVSGSGQKELVEVITGPRTASAGEPTVDGRDLTNVSPRTFIDNGVSFVPEGRNRCGSAEDLSVIHNAVMKDFHEDRFGSRVTLDYGELRAHAEALVEAFDVRGVHDVIDTTAGDLSGGNLQKLILTREVSRDPDLLVMNQSTRGVDVGAIESIREAIPDQRTEGTGVVLLSGDLNEIIDPSDRILVIYEGEVVYETTPEDADRERIGPEMTGGGGATATAGAQARGLDGSSWTSNCNSIPVEPSPRG